MRGEHSTRPNKLQEDVTLDIINHIKSFRGRKSHSWRNEKGLLPDTLNVVKMHSLYLQSHPSESEVSYETYRNILDIKFNTCIGFHLGILERIRVLNVMSLSKKSHSRELNSSLSLTASYIN
ncbi:vitamin B12-dependent ribonucleotide reductase [Elysia marginata]|uniref:Vitamin B12-dependent ribonucleotide reductase n=1 Tax=Elysia marginata TaxID=1093978 RepID=A0AAV4JJG9_9GAST|nr:vitamin B12-dependent ribonucleotide reductase [Elysia marginata]